MTTTEKIKVLVVDDSLFIRQVLTDILNADSEIEVVAEAGDGLEALQKLSKMTVDVVTLDLDMPRLDGFATLQRIMKMTRPPAVLIVSSYTQNGAAITLECLEAGAVDFVLKFVGSTSGSLPTLGPEIIKKVKIASKVNTEKIKVLSPSKILAIDSKQENKMGVVVIGSSTGGTVALEHLLPAMPSNFPYPILIAQHLPPKFVESLTKLLTTICQLPIKLGVEGDIIRPGTIYFAPGGGDMEIMKENNNEIKITLVENNDILTPSIDKLMESVAKVYGQDTLGIILTGMGTDGLVGMREIKEVHGRTLVQDEASSVVFGMGREVIKAGLADQVLPLDKLGQAIIDEYV